MPDRTEATRLALFAYALVIASSAALFMPIVHYGAFAVEAAAIVVLLVALYSRARPRPNPWLYALSIAGIALILAALAGIAAETAGFSKLERQNALTEAIIDMHRSGLIKAALFHLGAVVWSAVALWRLWHLKAQNAFLLFVLLWLSLPLLAGWMQLLGLFFPLKGYI